MELSSVSRGADEVVDDTSPITIRDAVDLTGEEDGVDLIEHQAGLADLEKRKTNFGKGLGKLLKGAAKSVGKGAAEEAGKQTVEKLVGGDSNSARTGRTGRTGRT